MFDYQKDGTGSLKRTYLDRICNSQEFEKLQYFSFAELPQLVCSACGERIGVPMVYKKENRLAFRLKEGMVKKELK